ncbi:MAG: glycosyltransferase family 2 protein [Janthinobacterium lividum]
MLADDLTLAPPRVSVVVAAYNASSFIGAAIASVQAQTEPSWELLVVDDCSTDETLEIVADLASRDARIRTIRTASNSGPGAARNLGFAAARGEWIAILDADDSYAPNRLETLLRLGELQDGDMVADNILLCDEAKVVPDTPMIPATLLPAPVRIGAAEFIARNVGSPELPRVSYGFLKPILRRSFLLAHAIRYDERNRFAEDYVLYVRCLLAGAAWWLTPGATYRYTVRKGSLTEEQTSGDLQRIREMEAGLLRDPAVIADPALSRAIRRHKTIIDRCYYYRAFTDAVKARQIKRATELLFEKPYSTYLIVREGARQMPVVLRKAMRGGYFKRKV